jgi:chromate reductase, NAD(P)H dehydrogenase (quinone)
MITIGGCRMGGQVRVLLVSGSTREGSTNTTALRTAMAVAPPQVSATLYGGLAALPAFNPDDDGDRLPPPAADLRRRIGAADAVVFCTPEYAGTLPGSFKNLLDWTVGGAEMYGKPAAWINVAAPGRGTGAQETLATVLGYIGAKVIEPACRQLPVARGLAAPDGTVPDPALRQGLAEVWQAILAFLRAG